MAKKYRPYFTLEELRIISHNIKLNGAVGNRSLARYIDTYISQIEAGLRSENYTSSPTIAQKLGFEEPEENNKSGRPDPQILYTAWQSNASLTVAELDIVNQYRYEHDLMTPDEEKRYETSLGLSH